MSDIREGRTARIVTAMADSMTAHRAVAERSVDRPSWDDRSLQKADKAVVDYWLAQLWRAPEDPSRGELADAFARRWTDTQDGAVITVSRVWPGWQTDNLANAWADIRSALAGYRWDPDDVLTQAGGREFRQEHRPAFGPIETGYQSERVVALRETVAVRDQQVGLIVRTAWDGSCGPALEIVTHERNRPAAERLMAAFVARVAAANIYRGQQLTVQGGRIKFTRIEPAAFEDVIVPADLLTRVRAGTVDMLAQREALARHGMGCGHAVVLAGRPGSGKTMICRAIATELAGRVTAWVVTAKAFYGASSVTDFYDMVRAFGPALVVFEDIDLIGRDRTAFAGHENSVLGELLTQWSGTQDNRDILTVASTNRFADLDEALVDRPERIGMRVDVGLPGPDERGRLFRAMAARYRTTITMDPAGWRSIVQATDGFTGDWIRATVGSAVRTAIARAPDVPVTLDEPALQGAVASMLRERTAMRRDDPLPGGRPIVRT